MNTMRLKNSSALICTALFTSIATIAATPFAVQAEEGKGDVPKELSEALGILETIPDVSGKTEEEIEAIVKSNPDIDKKIAAAEKKIQEAAAKIAQEGAVANKAADGTASVANGGTAKITWEGPAEMSGAVLQSLKQGAGDFSADTMDAMGDGNSTNAFDDVPFMTLNWVYGGFKGGDARMEDVTIGNLKMKSDGMSFKWVKDLSAWGISNDDASQALACLFVMNMNGEWVGGKFDWISSSRSTRDFKNIYGEYEGWSLEDVPNPCPAAFVVVSKDGKKRSNVIADIWQR